MERYAGVAMSMRPKRMEMKPSEGSVRRIYYDAIHSDVKKSSCSCYRST